MVTRKKRTSTDVDELLAKLLVDAYGDDAQLTALCERIVGALDLPIDVHVVGEPLSLSAVDYDGNSRRSLVARRRREDDGEHRVAFADIQLSPDVASYPYLAAYCRWLGVEQNPIKPLSAETRVRQHKVSEDDIELPGRPRTPWQPALHAQPPLGHQPPRGRCAHR